MKNTTRFLTYAASIAALYVILTLLSASLGLASGVIQLRLSEALTILPAFTPAAIPGLVVGCLLANALSGALPWDIVFGSLATLLGAFGTYLLRRHKWFAALPPIAANVLIVPLVLRYVYGVPDAYWFLLLTVGAGEFLSAGVLGTWLARALETRNVFGRSAVKRGKGERS